MNKLSKKFSCSVTLISILIIFIFANNIFAAGEPVNVSVPVVKNIETIKVVNSKVEPYQDLNISSKTGGIINKIDVVLGQYVEKGQTLIEFEQEEIEIRIQQAEAALKIAKANYKMLKDGATQEDLESIEAQYKQAVSSYEGAKNNLELLETIYKDRTAQKQQMVGADTQLKSARKQVEVAEEALLQAKNGLEQARNEYERIKYLYEENVATKKQYEMAENQYENAKSAVESARIAKEQADVSYQGAVENYGLSEDSYNNPTQLEQQLASARTQLKVAEANKKKAKANLDKVNKGARDEELITAEANVEQAEAALKQSHKALEDSIIKSPISGIVAKINFDAGEMAGPGTPLVQLVNLDKIYIKAEVTADLLVNIKEGDKVRVKVLAYQDKFLTGKIEYISPVADQNTQAFTVKVIAENPESLVKGGMFADVYFTTNRIKDALVVPAEVVMDIEGNPYLYILNNGKAERRMITVGITTDEEVVIIEGISQNDKVVVRGQNSISDGESVEVVNR